MSVTSLGTPTLARASAGSVTGTWGTGQSRVSGNLLVAVVSAVAQTSVTAPGAPAGWVKPVSATAGGRCSLGVFTRVATGADTAPSFSSTLSGTGAMTCTLWELSGQDPAAGLQTSATATGTTTNALGVTSAAAVAQAGSYAVCASALELTSAATDAATPKSGWAGITDDGATSDVVHTACIALAGPPAGSTLQGFVTWVAGGNSTAAVLAVFQPVMAPPKLAGQYMGII